MSVSDPSGAQRPRQDLLVGGSEREPRLSRRARLGAVAGVALLAAGAVGGSGYAQHRAEQRDQAAAFAKADRVHVAGEVLAVFGLEPGSGRLGAEVALSLRSGARTPQSVPALRLEGPGVVSLAPGRPGTVQQPARAVAESRVDCRAVAAGRIPDQAVVVVTVLPPSQVPHEQRLPVERSALREAVLAACDLPDPTAVPYVEASAQGATVVVFAEAVRRSDVDLRLEDVRMPGFVLGPARGFTLPHRIPPDSGGMYGFDVRVGDCNAARRSGLTLTVVLSQDGRREERVAPDAVQQPQRGAVPVAQLLRGLVERSC